VALLALWLVRTDRSGRQTVAQVCSKSEFEFVRNFKSKFSSRVARENSGRVDTGDFEFNNFRVNDPNVVRRIKTYSAENGAVYQYQFHEVRPATIDGEPGNEYIYYVTADRKTMHAVRVFVSRAGIEKWSAQSGRRLNGTEEYAAAKMRLFQEFDEMQESPKSNAVLRVDEMNVAALLEKLDL
jgi:hypothetical protein